MASRCKLAVAAAAYILLHYSLEEKKRKRRLRRMRDYSRRDKKCIVKSCSSTSQTTKESFFLFPRNRELAVMWAERLGVSSSFVDGQLTNQVVCGLHFPDTAFVTTDRKSLVRGCLPIAVGLEPTDDSKSFPYIPLNSLPTVLTAEDDLHVTRPTTTYSKSSMYPQPECSTGSAENTTLFTFEEEDVVVKEENLLLPCSSPLLSKTSEVEAKVVSSPSFCPNCNVSLGKIDAERPKSQELCQDGQQWLRPKDEREDFSEVLAQLEEEQQRNRELQAQLEVEQQQNKALQARLDSEIERSRELQAQLEVEQERSVGFVVQLDAERIRCSELRSQIKRQSAGEFEAETSQQLRHFLEALPCENNDIAIAAAKCGNTAAVKCLLASGTDVERRESKNGLTLLHLATDGGHTGTVKCLLTAGADVNAVTEDGTTPLHLAAYRGHKEMCEILLLMGACVNLQDIMQACPLHKAAQQGHLPVVQLLLQRGANPSLRDCVGQTPHDVATSRGHMHVAVSLPSQGTAMTSNISAEDAVFEIIH
ncbi:uncharacterized protein [Periplaneta americana]|uniref:uncharacterized protein isoform X2 n=1 Tax=Periplaneta americana TaxID=6978 RepID=UPI0037E7BA4C